MRILVTGGAGWLHAMVVCTARVTYTPPTIPRVPVLGIVSSWT